MRRFQSYNSETAIAHKETAIEIATFAAEVARRENKYLSPEAAKAAVELVAQARVLTTISLDECNGLRGPDGHAYWGEDEQVKADRARTEAQRVAANMAHDLFGAGVRLSLHSDPRGPSIRLTYDTREYCLDGGYQ